MTETNLKEKIKRLKKKYKDYSKKKEFKLNPDKKIVETVLKGLIKNKEKYGENYCVCRIVTRNKEKNKDIICPCKFYEQEIKEMGHCRCNLFVK